MRDALRALGDDATARQIVEHVYTDVDEKLWDAAEWAVQAQLELPAHLTRQTDAWRGRVVRTRRYVDLGERSLAGAAGQALGVGDQHALPSKRIQPRWAKSASALLTVSRDAPTS